MKINNCIISNNKIIWPLEEFFHHHLINSDKYKKIIHLNFKIYQTLVKYVAESFKKSKLNYNIWFIDFFLKSCLTFTTLQCFNFNYTYKSCVMILLILYKQL